MQTDGIYVFFLDVNTVVDAVLVMIPICMLDGIV